MCSGGHGFDSCRGLRVFLCPTLVVMLINSPFTLYLLLNKQLYISLPFLSCIPLPVIEYAQLLFLNWETWKMDIIICMWVVSWTSGVLGSPKFNSSATFVNSQPFRIFDHAMFVYLICFIFSFHWHKQDPLWVFISWYVIRNFQCYWNILNLTN